MLLHRAWRANSRSCQRVSLFRRANARLRHPEGTRDQLDSALYQCFSERSCQHCSRSKLDRTLTCRTMVSYTVFRGRAKVTTTNPSTLRSWSGSEFPELSVWDNAALLHHHQRRVRTGGHDRLSCSGTRNGSRSGRHPSRHVDELPPISHPSSARTAVFTNGRSAIPD